MKPMIRLWPIDRARPALGLILAGWLFFLVTASGPHLVHHLFDADGEPDCVFLATAEHAPAASAPPVVIDTPLATAERVHAAPESLGRASGARAPSTRGPPPTPLTLV